MKIKFYFPELFHQSKKDGIAKSIFKMMEKTGDIKYAGYLNKKNFYRNLSSNMGIPKEKDFYKSIDIKKKTEIKNIIQKTISRCYRELPHPQTPIFIFVFPWFPTKKSLKIFRGAFGTAPYVQTLHLFINPENLEKKALKELLAHEYNHLVFYYYHPKKEYTLLEHIVIEGLAENFREEIMGGKPAPWSLVISNRETGSQLKKIGNLLKTKSLKVYKEVFFGSQKYKKWTGYSLGYQLIKEFRKNHPRISWQEIIRMKARDFLKNKGV